MGGLQKMNKEIAKELRIGNIHYGSDFSIPRLGMHSTKIDGESFSYISSYGIHLVAIGKMEFRPIPISEEWLKYFGFKKEIDLCMFLDNTILQFRNNKLQLVDGADNVLVREIKCVHQLQNIYFYLEGKELNAK